MFVTICSKILKLFLRPLQRGECAGYPVSKPRGIGVVSVGIRKFMSCNPNIFATFNERI